MHRRRRGGAPFRRAAGTALFYVAVGAVLFTVLVPYMWMVSGSFKTTVELQAADVTRPGHEPSWIPRQFTWENYRNVNTTVPILDYFVHSLIISGGTMLCATLLGLAERLELMGCARILALLVGRRALTSFLRRRITRSECRARRALELAHELSDQLLFIHAVSFAPPARVGKIQDSWLTGSTVDATAPPPSIQPTPQMIANPLPANTPPRIATAPPASRKSQPSMR